MEQTYQQMYYHLFNILTDAQTCILRMEYEKAYDLLAKAQEEGEELYLSSGETEENEP